MEPWGWIALAFIVSWGIVWWFKIWKAAISHTIASAIMYTFFFKDYNVPGEWRLFIVLPFSFLIWKTWKILANRRACKQQLNQKI